MKTWAHEIRLAANDERHPDLDDATTDDAQQCVEFALALGQNLFVLPARITRGLAKARVKPAAESNSSATVNFELKQQEV
jgi:H2-forming N5,N10-methylenetetrahydromethanopterin dehydrogenase-like enzyme